MSVPLRTSVRTIRDSAVRRGIPVLSIDPENDAIVVGTGAWQRRMWLNTTSDMSHHAARIAADKAMTKRVLAQVGVPVSIGYPVLTLDDALTIASMLGYPVVLKPRKGSKGDLVFVELADETSLAGAWKIITASNPRGGVLIEEYLPGEEYRVLVINGKVVAVNHRTAPFVIGDGASTIQQLVDLENARPHRGPPHKGFPLIHIKVDKETHELLARANRTLNSVLPAGERQSIRRTTNASGGGATAEVTASVHPDNILLCELAARAVGLDIAGIDFIAPDISRPVLETGGGIIEINSGPGLIDHLQPGSGTPCDVGSLIMDMLYPPGSRTRAPIVAVIDACADAPLARSIARSLQQRGIESGLLVGDRVLVRGVELSPVDESEGLSMLLANSLVEAAVIHLNDKSQHRLPYCDVGVATDSALDEAKIPLGAHPEPGSGWFVVDSNGNNRTRYPAGARRLAVDALPEAVAEEIARLLGSGGPAG